MLNNLELINSIKNLATFGSFIVGIWLCIKFANNIFVKLIEEQAFINKSKGKILIPMIYLISGIVTIIMCGKVLLDIIAAKGNVVQVMFKMPVLELNVTFSNIIAFILVISFFYMTFTPYLTFWSIKLYFDKKIQCGDIRNLEDEPKRVLVFRNIEITKVLLIIGCLASYVVMAGLVTLGIAQVNSKQFNELLSTGVLIAFCIIIYTLICSFLYRLLDLSKDVKYILVSGNQQMECNYFIEVDDFYLYYSGNIEHYKRKNEVTDILVIDCGK